MKKDTNWLPFDSRLIPNIFAFKYPKNRWVRGMLVLEMLFAVLILVGTLVLVMMPQQSTSNAASQTSTINP